jgi:hypothetical protein
MGWDEVCIVCGICPSSHAYTSGPCRLLTNWQVWQQEQFPKITAEIVAINNTNFDETLAIVSEALSFPCYEDDENTIRRLRKVMPGLGDWSGFKRCMGIGQFNDGDGRAICQTDDESGLFKVPDGRQVEMRLVNGYDAGSFWQVIKENKDDATEEQEEIGYSHCSAYMTDGEGQPNIFVMEGCYHYLHAWLDWAALPPRKQAFPSDPAPLPFGAELYEIVNSEQDLRGERLPLLI